MFVDSFHCAVCIQLDVLLVRIFCVNLLKWTAIKLGVLCIRKRSSWHICYFLSLPADRQKRSSERKTFSQTRFSTDKMELRQIKALRLLRWVFYLRGIWYLARTNKSGEGAEENKHWRLSPGPMMNGDKGCSTVLTDVNRVCVSLMCAYLEQVSHPVMFLFIELSIHSYRNTHWQREP